MKINELSSVNNGILLLNKSLGMTSNKALQKAKKLLGAKKAGHTGSLDPLATGMLPICFEEATKICQFLLDADKCYETTGMLGIKTSTADAAGKVIAYSECFQVSQSQLQEVLTHYTGQLSQTPSMFSALKHKGVPLYRLARSGIEIERKERDIIIHDLRLNSFDGIQFELTVTCSKGTYIRNLVEDIGDSLNVGAYVSRLHRVYTAGLNHLPIYTLDELESMSLVERIACLIPMDKAIDYLPSMVLADDEVWAIRQGRVVNKNLDVEGMNCVRLYNESTQFIGLGEFSTTGILKAKRLLAY
ncbi:MAG: tRNA pseudouridine(55) synthase TruB [Legionella sp.]|uniref:tRNA pseudouridine(55) synthase TruB n=1 Tax=Legionella sp. TaxID=459 RepID=UPI0039E2F48F